jgi:hypothetical protein
VINDQPHPKGRKVLDIIAVFDIDGCILKDDKPLDVGQFMVQAHIDQGHFILFTTTRQISQADATSGTLQEMFGGILPFHDFTLLMRRDDDTRPELELKREFGHFIAQLAKEKNIQIAAVYDSNPEVVQMYHDDYQFAASVLTADGVNGVKQAAPEATARPATPFVDTPEAQRQPQPQVVNVGRAMARLFPNGVQLRTEQDFNDHLGFISTLASMLKSEE